MASAATGGSSSGFTSGGEKAGKKSSFDNFLECYSPSLLESLTPDPESKTKFPNRISREVFSGHYVLVDPTPIPRPRLVATSPVLLRQLGIEPEDVARDERFLRIFSADGPRVAAPGTFGSVAWATPYALTIYGQEMTQQCIFGTGNGYGDGRAASIGEVLIPPQKSDGESSRWEFQLKGSGATPFSRNADGRAVLRSSVREFLAEEAMHAYGISTTRALSLIVSSIGGETVERPWYDGKSLEERGVPTSVDDPRVRVTIRADNASNVERATLHMLATTVSAPGLLTCARFPICFCFVCNELMFFSSPGFALKIAQLSSSTLLSKQVGPMSCRTRE